MKAREVRMVSTCAALQAASTLATPAVKLIIAGTRPADISAITRDRGAVGVRQHDADRLALRRERHQLLAEDARAQQQLAIGQRARDRVLDRDAAHAVDLRRLDQRLRHRALDRRGAIDQVRHDLVERGARRLPAVLAACSAGSTVSLTGSSTVTVTLGNQRRRTWPLCSRVNGVESRPSSRTGTTKASVLSAIRPAPS